MDRHRLNLEGLKALGQVKGTADDAVLELCLAAAVSWVKDRVRYGAMSHPEVTQATLMLAWRLFKRRLSPEGVAGWDDMGQVRIIARDPDIDRLLEQHINAGRVWGIA